MKSFKDFNKKAEFLREASGSSSIKTTLLKAVSILHRFEIPHLVCGGFAVQEHGYPRFTSDVDIIVPNVEEARTRLSLNGFKSNPGSSMTVTDRETKVEIDLLPGGGKVGPGPLNLPKPTKVSNQPEILDLVTLINTKLSSYLGSKSKRIQDLADVSKLIEANKLPKNFKVDEKVKEVYEGIWEGLNEEE